MKCGNMMIASWIITQIINNENGKIGFKKEENRIK